MYKLDLNLEDYLNLSPLSNIVVDGGGGGGGGGEIPAIPENAIQAIGYHLTPSGTIWTDETEYGDERPVQSGRAYDFDGTDDRVSIGTVSASIKTVAFTVKLDTLANPAYIIALNGNTTYVRIVSGTVTPTGFPGSTTIYVDGKLSSTIPDTTAFHTVVIVCTAGTTISSGFLGFVNIVPPPDPPSVLDGKLFDVQLSSDQWTYSQVLYYHLKGFCGSPTTNIDFWYKCDDTHATIAYDSSGNGRNGTKTSITTSTFHYQNGIVPYSYQNSVGFTDNPTLGLVPRNESNIINDVTGATLEYTGRAPHHATMNSRCVTLNGSSDYIIFPFDCDGSTSLDVSLRFKHNGPTAVSDWLLDSRSATNDGVLIWFDATQNLVCRLRAGGVNNDISAGTGFANAQWHTVRMVWNGSVMEFFVDGISKGTVNVSGTVGDSNPWRIGRATSGTANFFPGQVADLYIKQNNVVMAHCSLADGAGTIIHDKSYLRNHGTATDIGNLTTFWGSTQNVYHANIIEGFFQKARFDQSQGKINSTYAVQSAGQIDIQFIPMNITSSDQVLFGVEDSTSQRFSLLINTSGNLVMQFKDQASAIVFSGAIKLYRTYTASVEWNGNDITVTLNGTSMNATVSSGTLPTSVLAFGGRNVGTALNTSSIINYIYVYNSSDVLVEQSLNYAARVPKSVIGECDLFTIGGQSNANGRGESHSTQTPTIGTAFEINAGVFSLLNDPVGTGSAISNLGSAWPIFGKNLYTNTGKNVIVVPTAFPGSDQFTEWAAPSGIRYVPSVENTWLAISLLTRIGVDVNYVGYLWCQGEADGVDINLGSRTKAQYKTALINMINELRVEFGDIKFIISRIGTITDESDAGFQQIRDAQDEVAASYAHVYMGFTNAINFPAQSKMLDEVHYNLAGLEEMGAALAVAAEGLIGEEYPSKLTNPAGAWHNRAETTIDFTGGVSGAPWANHIPNGYAVFNGSTSYISLINSLTLTGAFDISFDVYLSNATVTQSILGSSVNNLGIKLLASGGNIQNVTILDAGNYALGITLQQNTWYTFNIVRDVSNLVTITVNETLQGTPSTMSTTSTNINRIGSLNGSSEFLNGRLKNMIISIGGTEVFNTTLSRACCDSSGNNNHGIPTNITFPTHVIETAYAFGSSRTVPNYKNSVSIIKENAYHTLGI